MTFAKYRLASFQGNASGTKNNTLKNIQQQREMLDSHMFRQPLSGMQSTQGERSRTPEELKVDCSKSPQTRVGVMEARFGLCHVGVTDFAPVAPLREFDRHRRLIKRSALMVP